MGCHLRAARRLLPIRTTIFSAQRCPVSLRGSGLTLCVALSHHHRNNVKIAGRSTAQPTVRSARPIGCRRGAGPSRCSGRSDHAFPSADLSVERSCIFPAYWWCAAACSIYPAVPARSGHPRSLPRHRFDLKVDSRSEHHPLTVYPLSGGIEAVPPTAWARQLFNAV